MQRLLFFQPEGQPALPSAVLAALLEAIPGTTLEGRPGDAARVGTWRDAATGALAHLQVGDHGLEPDPLHPPRAYAGWQPLPVVVEIPLAGPHWFGVEALRVPETLLAHDPAWRALDEEDLSTDADGRPGPAAWDRPRMIASWERQRDAQILTRQPMPRLRRSASVSLWRYRRERARGQAAHPHHHWPPGHVLRLDATTAGSACVWLEPDHPVALPPVELVLLPGPPPRLLAADALAEALHGAGLIQTAGTAGARLVAGGAAAVAAGVPAASDSTPPLLDDDAWWD